jgi:hypothetical protein
MFSWMFRRRPDPDKWVPMSNTDDWDRIDDYKRAARDLRVNIKIGFPVRCVVGADYAAQYGYKGIYIARADEGHREALADAALGLITDRLICRAVEVGCEKYAKFRKPAPPEHPNPGAP